MDGILMAGDLISVLFLFVIFYIILIPGYSKKFTAIVYTAGALLIMTAYIALARAHPGLPNVGALFLVFTIPGFFLILFLSKYRGIRFAVVFCTINIVGFALAVIAKLLVVFFDFPAILYPEICLLLNIIFAWVFLKNKEELLDILKLRTEGWRTAAIAVSAAYGYFYFILLYPKPLEERPEYAPSVFVFSVLVLLCIAVLYWMIRESYKEKLTAENEDFMRRKLENLQMRLMISQMKPHFIANGMNAIRVLIRKDPKKASEMVKTFSDYLRASIDGIEMKEFITFKEELEHIRAYLTIQKMRFDSRLCVVYDIQAEDCFLPPLCVEPLVENAVHHGIAPREEGGTVVIRSWREERMFCITVEDDGVGFQAKKAELRQEEDSVGLTYVKYSVGRVKGAKIEIRSIPDCGTKVTLSFPQDSGEDSKEEVR